MRETIVGRTVIYPIPGGENFQRLNLSVLGEINGRLVDIRPRNRFYESEAPSIGEALLGGDGARPDANQPGFAVLRAEGVRSSRAVPWLAAGCTARTTSRNSSSSSGRFRLLLPPLDARPPGMSCRSTGNSPETGCARYEQSQRLCSIDVTARECPAVSRNSGTGAINVRLLRRRAPRRLETDASCALSTFNRHWAAPDINGNRGLRELRRLPLPRPARSLLFQESFEHSLGDWPVGAWIASDQGRGVSLPRTTGERPAPSRRTGIWPRD